MANDIVWFRSDETGAPTLNNAAGSLLAVLRACLVSGFRPLTLASITVAGGVATASYPAGHGYLDGVMVEVAGATPGGLNGRKKITVTGAGVFTFPAPGVADGTSAGTCKRSPLGWAEANSGNVSIFSRAESGSAAQGLRIDDTAAGVAGATYARAVCVEAWTDTATYSGLAPNATQLSGGQYWHKGANSAGAKQWVLIGDGRSFWLFADTSDAPFSSTGTLKAHCFLECTSFRSGDTYRTCIGGPVNAVASNPDFVLAPVRPSSALSGFSLVWSRRSSAVGGPINATWCAIASTGSSNVPGASGGPLYPAPVDGGLVLQYPTHLGEVSSAANTASNLRGVAPGLANPLADLSNEYSALHLSTLTDSVSGRQFMAVAVGHGDRTSANNRGVVFVDITGPWH